MIIRVRVDTADKCNGDNALFVSFDYNAQVVETIRAFPTRYWNKETREWELPIKKFVDLVSALHDHTIDISGNISALAENTKNVCKVVNGFSFKTSPYNHQIDGFNYGIEHSKWLLGDEQGLGKTKQVIDIAVAKKIQSHYEHCLIVCGVNGLKWNWLNEIQTHSNETGWILGQRVRANKITIGSTKDKIADIDNIDKISSYFIITNVESLRDATIQTKLGELCKSGKIPMVAIDEIHKCKNPSSQQGKGIMKLQPEYRVAMTGTPLMNTPMDLYIILRWLGYEKHAFYTFKNHYCVMGGYGGYEIVGYKNLDELQEQLNDLMLRRRKEDVLDLPEKIHIDDFVEMTPKQEQIYKEVSAEIKMNIDKIQASNNPLAELIRMRQATGFTGILSSAIRESAKLDRVEELVEEAVSNNRQVVIFSNWTQMTDAIWERLHTKYRLSVITGETKDIDRQDNVEEFQSNRSQVIVGTIGAMGTGLTLTAGTVEIFVDEPWNKALKDQAEDRCHRIGTQSNITIYTIMCKNTIDERIHDIVEKKGIMSDALVDGKIVGNKIELLNFLLS